METPKIVFTKSLNKSKWLNTDIATGDLKDEITKLKSQDGEGIHSLWWCLIRFFLD